MTRFQLCLLVACSIALGFNLAAIIVGHKHKPNCNIDDPVSYDAGAYVS